MRRTVSVVAIVCAVLGIAACSSGGSSNKAKVSTIAWPAPADPMARAQLLVTIAAETIDQGLRNVAILDYYLKHVDDESQLRILDRWLAEEILSLVFGGHKKSHFRQISFRQLRQMGLPSLLHRRRLILRGQIDAVHANFGNERVRVGNGSAAPLQ